MTLPKLHEAKTHPPRREEPPTNPDPGMPLLDPVTMSTPTRQAPDGRDKPKEAAKPMQPVVLFGDGMARAADGLSLLLLAGWLRLRFSSLVADPVSELVDWVQILAALQSAWVVLCCPPLGYHKKGVKPGFWVRSLSPRYNMPREEFLSELTSNDL